MKKKFITTTLALALAFSLAACGSPAASGPVDRDNVQSSTDTSMDNSEDNSDSDSSTQDTVEDTESSDALTKWYDSSDRTTLENQINNIFSSSGLTFSVTVEEPGTIIYNYKYNELQELDADGGEAVKAYFQQTLDSQYSVFIQDIQNFRDSYDLPVTTLRVRYINADDTELYSADYDENYVPAESSGTTSYASLEEWINSEEKTLVANMLNEQLASTGMSVDLYADGNILVLDFTFTEFIDLSGLDQEQIDSQIDTLLSSFSPVAANLLDTFDSNYGLILDDVRLIFRNADGTELYSRDSSDM